MLIIFNTIAGVTPLYNPSAGTKKARPYGRTFQHKPDYLRIPNLAMIAR